MIYLKKRALLQARQIMGENVEGDLRFVEDWLLMQRVGNSYSDKNNHAVNQDNIFGNTCAFMSLRGIKDPELLSVFKFHKLLEALEPKK